MNLLSRLDIPLMPFGMDSAHQHPLLSILSRGNDFNCEKNDLNKFKSSNESFIENSITKLFDELMDDQRENDENESPIVPNKISQSRMENTKSDSSNKRVLQVLCSNSQNVNKNCIESNDKQNKKVSFSLSDCSSPGSPRSFSPFKANDNSVKLFRSINSSHTICVEPTDVLQPLNEGEFAEYKLFPSSDRGAAKSPKHSRLDAFCSIFGNRTRECEELEIELLADCTPPSLSISGSTSSNSSSPNFFRF